MKYKTKWDLSHIYKSNPKRETKKDCAFTQKQYLAFAKKYRKNKAHLKSPKALSKAIEEYERLGKDVRGYRPIFYYSYVNHLNSDDIEAEKQLTKLSEFYADLANEIEFFILEIGKIPKTLQQKLLNSKELKPFKYFLKKLFESAKYHLTEAEEKIINLKTLPAHSMWTSGFDKLLNKQTVIMEGKVAPISLAVAKIPLLPKKERHSVYKNVMEKLKSISDFSESEINAIVTDKKINDRLRGFQTPYGHTVLGYENDIKTVNELVSAVNENMKVPHKFYKIKAEMMGEKTLTQADISAKVGEVKIKISFKEAVNKTIYAYNKADQEFGSFVKNMCEKGFVDVFSKKGKYGGAFCWSGPGLPVYVLLNHVNDFRSLTTIAHEMGHALHYKYAKNQRPLYENYTIASAEVASTFFENLVFEEELNQVSPKEKIILLHDKVADSIATVFRQIACFNFEVELHETVRREGFLTKEKIAELMVKHMQRYLGPSVKLTNDDGYIFTRWSHIRSFFYVYTYAFGNLISDSLYERYTKDKSKIKDVIKFLSAGGSDSPENIFRSIGINPNRKFFVAGINKIKKDIDELEKLWIAQGRKL